MNIEARLKKLEASLMPVTTNYHIIRMIVDPDDRQPVGFRCEEVEVYHRKDEPDSEYKARLSQSVEWAIGKSSRHIFEPIYSE